MAGISDNEYASKVKWIKSRENELIQGIDEIKHFKIKKPVPADPEKIREIVLTG